MYPSGSMLTAQAVDARTAVRHNACKGRFMILEDAYTGYRVPVLTFFKPFGLSAVWLLPHLDTSNPRLRDLEPRVEHGEIGRGARGNDAIPHETKLACRRRRAHLGGLHQ